MTPPTGLALRDVRVCFAALAAVDGVSFTLPRGEILAVLGPSGCGKSTLLRAIVGLEPLASGTMTWDDGDLSSVPVHRRGFGLVFQEGQLFGHMDVARNIDYGLRVAGMERAARRERVAELLALVGLDGFESREVGTLSGGEQQRVALARALAPSPRLLLLDEPFASLDSHLRTRLAADVREILRAENATAIVVTHDQDEAFAVADRIAIMEAGHLEDIGTPDRLWTWPASKAAARILGCRWFTQGRITMNPTPTLETPWGSVPLPTPP
ncbi:MAG: ABC transporter ATP-binding protein, partial [Micrococcales bacterium]|nr:ABC transporter ATP-binding protein [Micrococcales bacterium]